MKLTLNGKEREAKITVAVAQAFEKKFNKHFLDADTRDVPECVFILATALSQETKNSLSEKEATDQATALNIGELFGNIGLLYKEQTEIQKGLNPNPETQG